MITIGLDTTDNTKPDFLYSILTENRQSLFYSSWDYRETALVSLVVNLSLAGVICLFPTLGIKSHIADALTFPPHKQKTISK